MSGAFFLFLLLFGFGFGLDCDTDNLACEMAWDRVLHGRWLARCG